MKKLTFRNFILALAAALIAAAAPGGVRAEENGKYVVVIDAGHGGKDGGAISKSGLREKNVTLDIAQRIRAYLGQNKNIAVYLTRYGDSFVSLYNRRDKAYKAGADLMVSLHCDYYFDRSIRGFAVFTLSEKGKDWALKDAFADRAFLERAFNGRTDVTPEEARRVINLTTHRSVLLARKIMAVAERRFAMHNQKIKQAAFAVLKTISIPSVLVEVGFLTNPDEERDLRKPEYRAALARAIGDAIAEYFSELPQQNNSR